jgi:predicted RNase H-like HicB family nuclease
MTEQFYPIVIIKRADNDEKEYIAYALDLRGCKREGGTPAEALMNVQCAIGEWRLSMEEKGSPMPEPGGFLKEQQRQHEELIRQIRQDQDELRLELSEQKEELLLVKEQILTLKMRLEQIMAPQVATEDGDGANRRSQWIDVSDLLLDDELEIIIGKPKLPH